MLIPDSLRIGKMHYKVYQPLFSPKPNTYGAINYHLHTLHVAKRAPFDGKARTPAQRSETFWHEVTHGILYDMGHPLFSDEKFVTAFARRLSAAINSARFE
jgi:hypothetical protein